MMKFPSVVIRSQDHVFENVYEILKFWQTLKKKNFFSMMRKLLMVLRKNNSPFYQLALTIEIK